MLLKGGTSVTFTVDLSQVQYNDDGSVTVGDKNSKVCFDGDCLAEFLTSPMNTCIDLSDEEIDRIVEKFCDIPTVNPISAKDLKKVLERSNNESN